MARSNGLGTTSKELRGKGMEQGVESREQAAFQRSSFPSIPAGYGLRISNL